MLDTFELVTQDHWKAVAHPLRLGILALLRDASLTNEELAKQLGVESGKLYFHTKKLLIAGLIDSIGTRQKGPITEKLYRAVARSYYAPPPMVDGVVAPFAGMLTSALTLYQSSFELEPEQSSPCQLGYHVIVQISREQASRIAGEFKGIIERLITETDPGSDAVAVTIIMHSLPQSLVRLDPQGEDV